MLCSLIGSLVTGVFYFTTMYDSSKVIYPPEICQLMNDRKVWAQYVSNASSISSKDDQWWWWWCEPCFRGLLCAKDIFLCVEMLQKSCWLPLFLSLNKVLLLAKELALINIQPSSLNNGLFYAMKKLCNTSNLHPPLSILHPSSFSLYRRSWWQHILP